MKTTTLSLIFLALFCPKTLPDLLKDQDPLFNTGLFEGDIAGVDEKNLHNQVNEPHFWPKDHYISYKIDRSLGHVGKRAVRKAVRKLRGKTCVNFLRARRKDQIVFRAGEKCSAHIGAKSGKEVVLNRNCEKVGIVLHLIMHILGFWHENSRQDRDQYLLINWENVREDDQKNLQTYTSEKTNHMGEPFDFQSLMFITPKAYAINKDKATILSRDERFEIGQRFDLSRSDVEKIKIAYCGSKRRPTDDLMLDDEPVNRPQNMLASATRGRKRCVDRASKCELWEEQGRCQTRSRKIMQRYCAKTCNFCPTPLAPDTSGCQDRSTKCGLWAARGRCVASRREIMRRFCAKTCSLCPLEFDDVGGVDSCQNSNSLCGVWAWLGDCLEGSKINRERVLERCPLACGTCVPAGTEKPAEGLCRDLHSNCSRWTNNGRCFYLHTFKICPKTCGLCTGDFLAEDPGFVNCVDYWPTQCEVWARNGDCRRASVRKRCPRSCGTCLEGVQEVCRDNHDMCAKVSSESQLCRTDLVRKICHQTCSGCSSE